MKYGRMFVAVVAVFGLVAAGCGDDDDDPESGATTTTAGDDGGDDGGEPITIGIDGKSDDVNMFAFRYFPAKVQAHAGDTLDRKSTRLNSSHLVISYAVFCL